MRKRLLASVVASIASIACIPAAATNAGTTSSSGSGFLPSGRPAPQVTAPLPVAASAGANRASAGTEGCPLTRRAPGRPDNVRVIQDCGFVQQAEEWVSVNPADPGNVVVMQNDGSGAGTGFNQTSFSASTTGGETFTRNVPPPGLNRVPTSQGDERPYTRCSDPAGAHDRHGNFFYTCVAFNDPYGPESAVLVWRSNRCEKGRVLHDPAERSCKNPPLHYRPGTIVDNLAPGDETVFWDKELTAVDRYEASPYDGAVYVTVTRFNFACGQGHTQYCESPIWFLRSTDGGVTWDGQEISGANDAICIGGDFFDPSRSSDDCNLDQGSFPLVEVDGAIDVVFNNCNTPTLVCQQLFVRSTDGGDTWSDPAKVADDYSLQPFNVGDGPDQYGCPSFNQCLPPNGYRLNDYPAMGVDQKTGKLAVFWSDFRNGGPCEADPGTGLPTEPCSDHNNDVFVSVSEDHGETWTHARRVTRDIPAQWQAWGDVGENGKLYVAYYDRGYGNSEETGKNDITLAVSSDDGRHWSMRRLTTSSMPNMTCKRNAVECGFLGDYMALEWFRGQVYVVWGDTRPHEGKKPDSDTYFAKLQG